MLKAYTPRMPDRPTYKTRFSTDASDEEIARIVAEQLPNWKLACDNAEVDSIILRQTSFGRSQVEVALLHAAIRYAGIAGKTIMVVP